MHKGHIKRACKQTGCHFAYDETNEWKPWQVGASWGMFL